jgi:3-keto-5-aminohexanoate cleavage enzyme
MRAWNAGASIAQLHVWDESGQSAVELGAFEHTLALTRGQCDVIVEGSTGVVGTLTPAERSVPLQTDIEMASFNPGSVNYDSRVYASSPQDIRYWISELHRRGIKPDTAVFEAGMVANALEQFGLGLATPPYLSSFVLGQVGALPASPKNILFLSETIPSGSIWSVVGHNGHDLWTSVMAMSMGGHARAGFEDNPYYHPGEPAISNARLIERLVRIAREIGREPYTP